MTSTDLVKVPPAPPKFNAHDRCDKCGAQAYIQARLKSGGKLLFCRHHGEEYRAALAGAGAILEEDKEALAKLGAPMDVSPG